MDANRLSDSDVKSDITGSNEVYYSNSTVRPGNADLTDLTVKRYILGFLA
ncbi:MULTISPECIES: hypothetical protein [Campylobacter]|nr:MULTISPECIES: hypothetical protein [unclassified Campylobacter]